MKKTNKINQFWAKTNKPAFIIANTTWFIYWALTFNQDIDAIQNYIQSYVVYIVSYSGTKKVFKT